MCGPKPPFPIHIHTPIMVLYYKQRQDASSVMTRHSARREIGIRVSSENCKLRGLGMFLYRKICSAVYKIQAKTRLMKSQEVSFGVCKHRSLLNICS
jgi:hypothetical protein